MYAEKNESNYFRVLLHVFFKDLIYLKWLFPHVYILWNLWPGLYWLAFYLKKEMKMHDRQQSNEDI